MKGNGQTVRGLETAAGAASGPEEKPESGERLITGLSSYRS